MNLNSDVPFRSSKPKTTWKISPHSGPKLLLLILRDNGKIIVKPFEVRVLLWDEGIVSTDSSSAAAFTTLGKKIGS